MKRLKIRHTFIYWTYTFLVQMGKIISSIKLYNLGIQ